MRPEGAEFEAVASRPRDPHSESRAPNRLSHASASDTSGDVPDVNGRSFLIEAVLGAPGESVGPCAAAWRGSARRFSGGDGVRLLTLKINGFLGVFGMRHKNGHKKIAGR